jgi:hypothetical protein
MIRYFPAYMTLQLSLLSLIAILLPPTSLAREEDSAVQAVIGAVKFDDLTFENTGSDGTTTSSDLSTMPVLGIVGQMPLWGDNISCGIEAGALISWRSDNTSTASSNGRIVVRMDSRLVLIDVFTGILLNVPLGDQARAYIGAGPLLMIADYKEDSSEESDTLTSRRDETDSDTTLGVYSRAGVEVLVSAGGLMGIGVRALSADLSFDNTEGDVELDGVQGFITYTVGW